MIKIYKDADQGLIGVKSIEQDCWINIIHPSQSEISETSKLLKVQEEYITDALDIDERSRFHTEDGHLLIILRIPYYDDKDPDVPYKTAPLGIIYSSDYVATVTSAETDVLSAFFDKKNKSFPLKNREKFVYSIFLQSATLYLKYLKQINNISLDLEEEVHKSMKNQEIIKLIHLEKSLVYFTTSLKANELMIERLIAAKKIILGPEDADIIDDVVVEYHQAIDMAEVYSNILTGMMDAFASLISNNLNVTIKILTSITIILMLPTLVASIYGMNIPLPFQQSGHAFLITMGFSFIISICCILWFKNRKWF